MVGSSLVAPLVALAHAVAEGRDALRGHEVHRAAAEAVRGYLGNDAARTQLGSRDHRVRVGAGDVVIVAQADVGLGRQHSHSRQLGAAERRSETAGVLGHHVMTALRTRPPTTTRKRIDAADRPHANLRGAPERCPNPCSRERQLATDVNITLILMYPKVYPTLPVWRVPARPAWRAACRIRLIGLACRG
jgi:hypothetical protein